MSSTPILESGHYYWYEPDEDDHIEDGWAVHCRFVDPHGGEYIEPRAYVNTETMAKHILTLLAGEYHDWNNDEVYGPY